MEHRIFERGVPSPENEPLTFLWNVNFDGHDDPSLVPRIPASAGPGEDLITRRICLSTSLCGCLQAIGRRDIRIGAVITAKRVPMPDLDDRFLYTPEMLYDEEKVPDALENREWWYTAPAYADVLHFRIESFDYNQCYAWTCVYPEAIRCIAEKYVPNLPWRPNPEKIYKTAMDALWREKRYGDADAFDEEVASLPWIQKTEIRNLSLLEINEDPCRKRKEPAA